MPTTSYYGLPYPVPTDPVAAGANNIKDLADRIDTLRPVTGPGAQKWFHHSGRTAMTFGAGGLCAFNWPAVSGVTITGCFGVVVCNGHGHASTAHLLFSVYDASPPDANGFVVMGYDTIANALLTTGSYRVGWMALLSAAP